MEGIFDFEDSLKELFSNQNAIVERDIKNLAGKKIAISETLISREFLRISQNNQKTLFASYSHFVEDYVHQLRSRNIDFTIVTTGSFLLNDLRLTEIIRVLNRTYWKCYFFILNHQKYEDEEARTISLKYDMKIFNCLHGDELIANINNQFYQPFKLNIFNKLNVKFVVAPKLKHNQLYWMFIDKKISFIACSFFCFAFSNVDQIISHFDFQKEKYYLYDFKIFAESFKLSINQARASIFLLFCKFVIKTEQGITPKLHRSLILPHEKIVESYEQFSKENAHEAKKLFISVSKFESSSFLKMI